MICLKKVLVRFKRPRQTVAFSVFLCLLMFLFHFRSFLGWGGEAGQVRQVESPCQPARLLAYLLSYVFAYSVRLMAPYQTPTSKARRGYLSSLTT